MQVNFSDQSMGEIDRLDRMKQVEIIGQLGDLRREQFLDSSDPEVFGRIHRDDRTFYRIRIGDLRFYVEIEGEEIFCHYVLPKHSFDDFCFRFGLRQKKEPDLEQEQRFWEFLQSIDDRGGKDDE